MTATINDALQVLQMDAFSPLFDSGFLDLYTGTQPDPSDAPTGTLLVSIALQADAFQASTISGVAFGNGNPVGAAVDTGVIGYGQLRSADSTKWMYMSASLTGLGGDIQMNNTTITFVGQFITASFFALEQPASP